MLSLIAVLQFKIRAKINITHTLKWVWNVFFIIYISSMCLSKSRDIGWDGKGRGQVFKTTKHKKRNLISKCTLILPMFDWNIIVCFRDKTKSFFSLFYQDKWPLPYLSLCSYAPEKRVIVFLFTNVLGEHKANIFDISKSMKKPKE